MRKIEGNGNPDYGLGFYRRSIRLVSRDVGTVTGELQDNYHAMACTIAHDGVTVSAVDPLFVRVPTNQCGGAAEPALALVGVPIAISFGDFFGGGRPFAHCSHMFDLVWLMLRQAQRGIGARMYEIEVPDHPGPGTERVTLSCDGVPALEWQVAGGVIAAPEPFAGRAVLSGFVRWAREALADDALDAALVLQKGYMVSRARQFSRRQLAGPMTASDEVMRDMCWAYSTPRFDEAVRRDSYRDLDDSESLARFG